MIQGFKDFLMRGNVIDLAVAVVIGTAFGAVINALVASVLMPLISALVGAPNFDEFAVVTINGNDLKFGVLLTALVNFLLIAAAVYFAFVLPVNKMMEARERKLAAGRKLEPEEVPADIQLLTEIRDALRGRT